MPLTQQQQIAENNRLFFQQQQHNRMLAAQRQLADEQRHRHNLGHHPHSPKQDHQPGMGLMGYAVLAVGFLVYIGARHGCHKKDRMDVRPQPELAPTPDMRPRNTPRPRPY